MNKVCDVMATNNTVGLEVLISQQVEKECAAIHANAEITARAFYKEMAAKIPGWVENYSSLRRVDNIIKIKSQAKLYTEELVESLLGFIKNETQAWAREVFIPMIGKEIYNLSSSLNNHAKVAHESLEKMNVSIDIDKNAIVDDSTPSAGNKILSSGASLLIGDIGGAIMGGVGGYDAMLKTMGCEFAAGLTLGIISLFTPVGMIAFVGSIIASAFVGGSWAMSGIEKNIRKAVVKCSLENFNSPQEIDKFIGIMHGKIDSLLKPLCKELAWI